MGRILAAILLAALVPLASAEVPTEPGIYNPDVSTPTTMYFHINGIQDTPINTQKPDDRYADTPDRSIPSNSGCVDVPEDPVTFTEQSHHTWYGFSSPSIVEYDVDQGGEPRYHPERGISYDIEFDTSVTPVLHWYLETRNPGPAEPDTDVVAIPIPEVVLRGTVREGDDVSVGNEALNTGKIVAQGQTEKHLLAGSATTETEQLKVHQTEDGFVYEFIVEMPLQEDTIDKDQAYNIRVDAFIDNPYCPEPKSHEEGEYAMIGSVYVHTSQAMRPRVDWNIMNPLLIEALHPQFVGDDLVVHTFSNSPWGSYDVMGDIALDPGDIELEITGPTTPVSLDKIAHQDHTRAHYSHTEPVSAVWLWDYKADQAEDGLYTVTMHITNDQENADAYAVATFQIGDGADQVCSKNLGEDELHCITPDDIVDDVESPGVGILALLGLLGALVRRR